MKTATCNSCKITKPLSEGCLFRNREKYLYFTCRVCKRASLLKRNANPIAMEKLRKGLAFYKIKYKEHIKARYRVYRAIRENRLIKPKRCSSCSMETYIEAHHHQGYDRKNWLNVIWLCRLCHREHDKMMKGQPKTNRS